jgi:transcriptional regulator with GAF, ATPase, and Fis domain
MNAYARIATPPQAVDPGLSIDAGLAKIGDIAATLAGPGSAPESLRRVLQEGEFERVGGAKTLRVNPRVIAATASDLEAAVRTWSARAR